jgi:branched-chain amino acid transport system permease protein
MTLLQHFFSALTLGGFYVTFALGLTIIYSILKIVHLAHATTFLIAAYFTYFFHVNLGFDLPVAIVISILLSGAIGMIIGFMYQPLVKKGEFAMTLLLSLAVYLASVEAFYLGFGTRHLTYPIAYNLLAIEIAGSKVFLIQFLGAISAFVSIVLLWVYLAKTEEGRVTRAIIQNLEFCQALGINPLKSYALAFFIGSLLAGFSGCLTSLYYNDVHPSLPFEPLVIALCILVIGGLGSLAGTIVAGYALAFAETFALAYIPLQFPRELVAFVLLLAILLIRPTGLMGGRK